MTESNTRSLIKTISWRLTGSGATFIITYAISEDFSIAGTVAAIQVMANTVLYYAHERLWNKINWGRK